MLQMGFQEPVEDIFREMPEDKQTTLWSATMPSEPSLILSRGWKRKRPRGGEARASRGCCTTLLVGCCVSDGVAARVANREFRKSRF